AAVRGVDWRAVVDGLRPHSQAIWQGFSAEERSRFLRYARSFWEGHRHRIASQLAEVLVRMEAEGRLKYHAGRLQTLDVDASGVDAVFRRRGTIQHVALRVVKVVNCTGPRTDYSKYQHPLFIHLLARGLIDHDPLALGISARPTGEVLRYRGDEVGWLFTLGAPLKGVLWETTSVREIREQASALATRLLASEVDAGAR
ncbi:MAG TPA: FAD-dependent oxidoreductase, partial [Opitutus sp.]|nr:FAD-dependent oxidoreductase [Opitutus sp.]